MGIAKDIMKREKTVSAAIYTAEQTFINGEVGSKTWTLSKTADALFWLSSQRDAYVSEKFSVDVDVVFAFDSDSVSVSDVPDTAKITVNDIDYAVITSVDIAEQGELLIVYGKKI